MDNITVNLNNADTRMSTLLDIITPDYTYLVEKEVCIKAEKLIENMCNSEQTTKKLGPILDTKIDKYSDKRLKVITNQSCEIMKEKANAIAATVNTKIDDYSEKQLNAIINESYMILGNKANAITATVNERIHKKHDHQHIRQHINQARK